MNDLIKRLKALLHNVQELTEHLNIPQKEQRLLELEDQMQLSDFWDNNEEAQKLTQEYNQTKGFVEFWAKLENDINELLKLVESNNDESDEVKTYLEKQVLDLESQYNQNRFLAFFSKKYDDHNAIFSIHAGAGGTDAQDWAEMLLRMYLRFCEKRGWRASVVDEHKGGEAGIKSVTVEVYGPYVYGILKNEAGTHRLVRLSPFNPAHTRETSFALFEVLPLLEQQEAVSLDPKDLQIETTTASGHGGQSVNTTYSAVRITHIPTGIKVSIQNERSQHQNKELALKILTAKVQTQQDEKLAQEKKELRGEFKSAEWGSQIRSYILHPYKLVKDHRTNYEDSNPDDVLDGKLDDFIEKYLETAIK